MAIHLGQFEAGSHLKRHEYFMELCTLPTVSSTVYANALSLATKNAGDSTGFVSKYTNQPLNLYLSLICAAGVFNTIVFRVTGENHFGEAVTELVTIVGAPSSTVSAFTVNCYRRVTAITIDSITAGTTPIAAGITFSVGTSNVAGCRYPVWSRTIPAVAIKALVYAGQTGNAVTTHILDKTYNNIREAGSGAVGGMVALYLDPKYERYY